MHSGKTNQRTTITQRKNIFQKLNSFDHLCEITRWPGTTVHIWCMPNAVYPYIVGFEKLYSIKYHVVSSTSRMIIQILYTMVGW